MNRSDLVNSAEAAAINGVDRATFNRWVKSGRIVPAVEMPGATGARLFNRDDVEALAKSRAMGSDESAVPAP